MDVGLRLTCIRSKFSQTRSSLYKAAAGESHSPPRNKCADVGGCESLLPHWSGKSTFFAQRLLLILYISYTILCLFAQPFSQLHSFFFATSLPHESLASSILAGDPRLWQTSFCIEDGVRWYWWHNLGHILPLNRWRHRGQCPLSIDITYPLEPSLAAPLPRSSQRIQLLNSGFCAVEVADDFVVFNSG